MTHEKKQVIEEARQEERDRLANAAKWLVLIVFLFFPCFLFVAKGEWAPRQSCFFFFVLAFTFFCPKRSVSASPTLQRERLTNAVFVFVAFVFLLWAGLASLPLIAYGAGICAVLICFYCPPYASFFPSVHVNVCGVCSFSFLFVGWPCFLFLLRTSAYVQSLFLVFPFLTSFPPSLPSTARTLPPPAPPPPPLRALSPWQPQEHPFHQYWLKDSPEEVIAKNNILLQDFLRRNPN
jgi:hypothetical protein